MSSSSSYSNIQKTFLKYQHVFVFLAPVVFILGVFFFAPTEGSGTSYWLEYWWLLPFFVLGATTVNTVGISGSALFVPFFIFIFPLIDGSTLTPQTLVAVGLISESFGLSSSALAFVQYGLVDRKLALTLVGGAVPFVVGGAVLSFFIPEAVFQTLLGIALLAAAFLLFKADLAHEEPGAADDDDDHATAADGGSALPNDDDKLGPAGVETDDDGIVTRVDRDGEDYTYDRSGYTERFANYSIGGVFQGLAGFGIGELGIISMLRSSIPVRVAIGTNHIVVASTAILASLVHVFGGSFVPGAHSIDIASTPWNMVVWTVPATVTGGQIAPYVASALDTETIKHGVGILFGIIALALFIIARSGMLDILSGLL
ncbi:sulfite exporter TauE/SafE family protein [Haloarchaeobius sp. HME9146]|uniref:sulfite exporter TauE/SafE family protein n=1 Tax=Haloarchaeobius sp. HME9146 TaxID=2978732 RepID=UPI0021BE65D5|nr:sulfite exporter TauE/SafE family protein [Haloarchaeobius sp. HME9146]MCT9094890.1 sulfite exporter TauE/SafE family protein [Haloarchaeobius sp. HME9146]